MTSVKPNIILAAERGEFHDYIEDLLESCNDPIYSNMTDEEIAEMAEEQEPSAEDFDEEFKEL